MSELREALKRAHAALSERDSKHAPTTAHSDPPCTPETCYIEAALAWNESGLGMTRYTAGELILPSDFDAHRPGADCDRFESHTHMADGSIRLPAVEAGEPADRGEGPDR